MRRRIGRNEWEHENRTYDDRELDAHGKRDEHGEGGEAQTVTVDLADDELILERVGAFPPSF